MTLSKYPQSFDDDKNLYLVHDGLRVRLAEDYNPGDTEITVDPDSVLFRFPPTGIITLTDQCSEIDSRAISFEYTGIDTDNSQFTGLTLLDGFTDVAKPKRFTNVLLNVIDRHHNSLKDAVIQIEHFAGKRGGKALTPLNGTMEERINFLRSKVLVPKAWVVPNQTVGVVPLTVEFRDLSLRAPTKYEYDFGDGNTLVMNFPYVPGQAEGTASTIPDGSVEHTYTTPGNYDVTVKVTNPFGSNEITFTKMINARTLAPDPATIEFNPSATQLLQSGVLRTRVNTPIEIDVTASGEQALDPIVGYDWSLSDDLLHPNINRTEAQYSVGGLYTVKLRTDTTLGAYRITTFPNVIDVIERSNLWISICDPNAPSSAVTKNVYTYEFGLLSETFKVKSYNPLSVSRNPGFLSGVPNEAQQKQEFMRNVGMTPKSLTTSGDQGIALMYWAEGGANAAASQNIRFSEFNGFTDTYTTPTIGTGSTIGRNWNWCSLNAPQSVYFLFGQTSASSDLTNTALTELDLASYTVGSTTLKGSNFENGAEELLTNVGDGSDGEFNVYRTTWKDSTGYILRNEGTGDYFRLKSFYRTEGVLSDPVKSFRKLPDILGAIKLEGQLVALVDGIYFFNNTGEVCVYDTIANLWASGGPGIGSPMFATLQDKTVTNFDNPANTLLAASDGDRTAFLSFDYGTGAFMKFDQTDRTFNRLPNRPVGEQFAMTIY